MRTINYGVIVYNVTDFTRGIAQGREMFQQKYHAAPNMLQLPRKLDSTTLDFDPLVLSDLPAPPGCVIVGVGKAEG